jgi:hypothetical protein
VDESDLIDQVSSLASTYLGKGLPVFSVRTAAPDDRINKIEELLLRYFVVTGIEQYEDPTSPSREQPSPDVIQFVQKLPGRITRLKHTTNRSVEVSRGEIRGQIDWPATIETRSRRSPNDRTLFAYRQTNDRAEIIENRVLATLIDRLHSTVGELRSTADSSDGYDWLDPWLGADSHLWTVLEQLKFQNPYLSEIDVDSTPVPSHALDDVRTARTPLYREAAKLLERYQRYERGNYDDEELRDLFNTLFVEPEDTDQLFELYWAYKTVQAFDDRLLEPVVDSSKLVARWTTDESEYALRYRTSSKEPPTFYVSAAGESRSKAVLDREFPDGGTYLQRNLAAVERAATTKEELLGNTGVERSLWSGEPDLLLTKRSRDKETLEGVFIGEVKWSKSGEQTAVARQARNGIDDLTEYVELVQGAHGEYLNSETTSVTVEAAVFTRDFKPERRQSGSIKLVTYGDDVKRPLTTEEAGSSRQESFES